MGEKIKILFLAAGADEETRRRSEREAREISRLLRAGNEREAFHLVTSWAVRATDLQALLLEHRPHVVHLSGRANEAGDILLSDDGEGSRPVSLEAMAGLFRILRDDISLVVLNAPYAARLAQHLRWIIDYVVAMKGDIGAEAAVIFSAHFYQALGYSRTVAEAFKLAVNQLMLEGNTGYEQPCLYVKAEADKSRRLMLGRADVASVSAQQEIRDTAQRPLRIFLCYSHGDRALVRDLHRRLAQAGFDPWLDEEKILAGQDWQYEITKAVRATDVVIVCLSRGAVTKRGFIHKEIKQALDVADRQPEGTIFLVPLKLEECEVPERLRHWHSIKLFEEKGYAQLLTSLTYCSKSLE